MDVMTVIKGLAALWALCVVALFMGYWLGPKNNKTKPDPASNKSPDPTPSSRLRNYKRPLPYQEKRQRAAQNRHSADIYTADWDRHHHTAMAISEGDTGRFSSGGCSGSDFGSSGGSSSGSSSSSSCGSDD